MQNMQKNLSNFFYVILGLPSTAMGFALCVQISALSWILSTQFHLEIDKVGYVWAAGPLAGIFGQVIVGFISDKVWFLGGRRRPFILVGGTLAAAMLLALPNIDKISHFLGLANIMVVAVTVALSLDLAINISFNPTRSIIADVTPEGDERTKGFTWMQTISGLCGVLAYLIGAYWNNYVLIYVGVGVVFCFSVLPIFFITEPREVKEKPKDEDAVFAPVNPVRQLTFIYLAHAFTWLGVQTMFVYTFFFIQQKMSYLFPGLEKAQLDHSLGQINSIAFAVLNTVGFLLPAFVLEPLAKKIGRVKIHTMALCIMAFGYLGVVFVCQTPAVLYFWMAVVGVGWASVVSLAFAIFSENVDPKKMGLYMGTFNLSVVFPQLIVSFVLGDYIKAAADKNLIFMISGVALMTSTFLWFFVRETDQSKYFSGTKTK